MTLSDLLVNAFYSHDRRRPINEPFFGGPWSEPAPVSLAVADFISYPYSRVQAHTRRVQQGLEEMEAKQALKCLIIRCNSENC